MISTVVCFSLRDFLDVIATGGIEINLTKNTAGFFDKIFRCVVFCIASEAAHQRICLLSQGFLKPFASFLFRKYKEVT
jgi:hypothetical protein